MRLAMTTMVIVLGLALKPAPAHAGRSDVVAAVTGLLLLGIVASSLDRARAAPVGSRSTATGRSQTTGLTPLGRTDGYRSKQDTRILPRECLRSYRSKGETYSAFGQACLQRTYAFSRRLPQQCERAASTASGYKVVYSPRCLQRAGYRIEARR